MFRHFLIKIFFLQTLPMFCNGNKKLKEEVAKLKSEVFEIKFYFTEMNELDSKMSDLFEMQIAINQNFMKIFDEINEKKNVIIAELSEKIETKIVNLKAKMAVENLKTNLQSLNDPFLMLNPAGISEILKSEYSILSGITKQKVTQSEKIFKGVSAKRNENKNEICQKMEELGILLNSIIEQIQILVNSKSNDLEFVEMTRQYWLLYLMRKLAEDGLRLLNGLLKIEAEPADLAYGQIGRHLDWLKGKIGVEGEIWMNIAIDQEMAKKLAKIKENKIQIEIFNELAGRKFSNKQKLDKMEWKLFVLIAKILDLYYFEKKKKEQKLKRKRGDGNNSDSNVSKNRHLINEKERNLKNILENAPIDLKNKFPQHFTDILHTNGLIDSVKSIEAIKEHQKFMAHKLKLSQYDDEWKNGGIIFNEFEKKITKTGDLLEEAIEEVMEEMGKTLLPEKMKEIENIISQLRVFLYGDEMELLVKKDATVLKNKLENILKKLGNEKFEELKIFDGPLGILQREIVEFQYFLTRGQKFWKKFAYDIKIPPKGKKYKNDVGPLNLVNAKIIEEIFDEEIKILGWMEKLKEIGLDAIELHISLQKWYLSPKDQKLHEETKEKLTKLKTFLNDNMEIAGTAGANYIGTKLDEMNEKGLRVELVERKRLEAVIKKLINYENYYSSSLEN